MRILLVIYDNDSYMHWFPQGAASIAAVLLKEGHEVELYSQDMFHYPEEHLTQYLDRNRFDAVGIGIIAGYYQYRKLLRLSKAIHRSKKRPVYVLGGHGPSPEPEFFLKETGADAIVMGEGEGTIVDLARAIEDHGSFSGIKGIAYRDGRRFVINEKRPLIQNIDSIPLPSYKLFPMEYYRLLRMPHAANRDFVMPVLSGRGCVFTCSFCYRMDKGFRPRGNAAIIDEIKLLQRDYGITYIVFSDELLMSSVSRTMSLCEDLISSRIRIKWTCNGRLNYARSDLLKMMKRAGCVFINYGIEAVDDRVLRNMNKALTTKQIFEGVETTLKIGISPGLNIIFGNIGDSRDTLRKGVDFLLKYDDGAQLRTIRPVTPYPGSPLYYHAIRKGLLKDVRDFYVNKHLNSDLLSINFTKMKDDEFHRCLFEANEELITSYFRKKRLSVVEQARGLYLDNDTNFRGFRQT